jgi:hypothetical protein
MRRIPRKGARWFVRQNNVCLEEGMDWTSLVGPAVVAAGVSGVVSVAGFFVSARTARSIHTERLTFDNDLAERRFNYEKELAERKFQYEREFHDHKRRVELAETILAEFLQISDIIQNVRSPAGYWDEGSGRPRSEDETDDQARQLDSYYVPLVRLTKHSDLISGLMSKRYRANAVLGGEIEQAFQEITKVISRVRTSSEALMHSVKQPESVRVRNQANIEHYETDIWGGLPETDRLQPMVNRAIEIVEKVCRAILGGDRAA